MNIQRQRERRLELLKSVAHLEAIAQQGSYEDMQTVIKTYREMWLAAAVAAEQGVKAPPPDEGEHTAQVFLLEITTPVTAYYSFDDDGLVELNGLWISGDIFNAVSEGNRSWVIHQIEEEIKSDEESAEIDEGLSYLDHGI